MKVYGPYTRKDNRKHVIIINDDGSRRTVSYPKYLMEQKLGKELDPNLETVDHKDENFNNNDDQNVRIMTRSEHIKDDILRVRIDKIFICPMCKKEFRVKNANWCINNRLKGKAGPFCSRNCAGKYGALLKNGEIEELEIDKTDYRIYYTNKRARVAELEQATDLKSVDT
jgi:hypothetical protein